MDVLTEVDGMKRTQSGVDKLDDLIEGGFPSNTVVLVSGPPGGGKTIFTFQYLKKGLELGEKCLFLTLDKRVDNLLMQANELGIDFRPAMDEGKMNFIYMNSNERLLYDAMRNEVVDGDYDRIVLDSITPLSEIPLVKQTEASGDSIKIINREDLGSRGDLSDKRARLFYIMDAFSQANATTLVTSELPADSRGYSRDSVSEFLADGVIILKYDPAMDRRKLTVVKMRGTKHTLKPQDMEIGQGGIHLK